MAKNTPVRIKSDNYERARSVADRLKPAVPVQALINEMVRECLPKWEKKVKIPNEF